MSVVKRMTCVSVWPFVLPVLTSPFIPFNLPGHVCHPSPCLHGGHCRVFYGHSKCYCPPLYKGNKCESMYINFSDSSVSCSLLSKVKRSDDQNI